MDFKEAQGYPVYEIDGFDKKVIQVVDMNDKILFRFLDVGKNLFITSFSMTRYTFLSLLMSVVSFATGYKFYSNRVSRADRELIVASSNRYLKKSLKLYLLEDNPQFVVSFISKRNRKMVSHSFDFSYDDLYELIHVFRDELIKYSVVRKR